MKWMKLWLSLMISLLNPKFLVTTLRFSTRSTLSHTSTHVITSTANEKVKLLKSLSSKKGRNEHQLSLLEGHRKLQDAIDNGIVPTCVLYDVDGASSALWDRLSASLSQLPNVGDIVFPVKQHIIKYISDTVTPQGVVASVHIPTKLQSFAMIRNTLKSKAGNPAVLIADRLGDPGNMGSILRSAHGFGMDAVICAEGVDVWCPKVLRSSMGSSLKLPVAQASWNEVTDFLSSVCEMQDCLLAWLSAHPEARVYSDMDFTRTSIIVVGNEAHGLSKEALELASVFSRTNRILIPMHGSLESFNAAVAAAVVMSEISRQRR